MSACLGAVVRAPVTGILIVFEMTHEFSLVPALMVGALVSQAISRKLNRHSFYEEILVQDGHRLEHVIPPPDLRSWQQLPVAAVANFHPVMATELTFAVIQKLLQGHPYQRFPVVLSGTVAGILTRKEAEAALAARRPPSLEPAVTCLRKDSIAELQARLIESNSLIVVLLDRPGGQALGMVTLHDLLRAQAAMSGAGTVELFMRGRGMAHGRTSTANPHSAACGGGRRLTRRRATRGPGQSPGGQSSGFWRR
jgi:CIC family chloride channel protein